MADARIRKGGKRSRPVLDGIDRPGQAYQIITAMPAPLIVGAGKLVNGSEVHADA